MGKVIAIIGHSTLNNVVQIKKRLINILDFYINKGYTKILIGIHGQFDTLALNVCRQLKEKYINLNIEVILTSLNLLKKGKFGNCKIDKYKDVKTKFYEIENLHYKNIITFSNKMMIKESDLVICYINVNKEKSGAKKSLTFAKKEKKHIINIYDPNDDILNYKTTKEVIDKMNDLLNKFKQKATK